MAERGPRTALAAGRACGRSLMRPGSAPGGHAPDPGRPPPPQESDGWRILSYMLGGMILYGAIGWLIGRWTGVPVLFPAGMITGLAGSIALIIFRVTRS